MKTIAPKDKLVELGLAAFQAMAHGLGTGDFAAFFDWLDEDVTVTFWGSTAAAGHFRGKKVAKRWFGGATPYVFKTGLKFELKNIWTTYPLGNTVGFEWEDDGIAVNDYHYHNFGLSIYEFKDGKIIAFREFCDTERLAKCM